MFRSLASVLATLAAVAALPAFGHETWLDAKRWQVAPESRIAVDLINGERFAGIELAYFQRRIERLEALRDGAGAPIDGRAGDIPAIQMDAGAEGLVRIVYRSNLSRLTYTEDNQFADFVAHKALEGTMAAHTARGLPETGFNEGYRRFAKALIGVGDGAGRDTRAGLETEFVALANPYTDDLSGGLPVQLFYRQDVRADAQIEIFERAPDGNVTVSTLRTDAEGRATIPVRPGHVYLLDAVVIREPEPVLAEEEEIVWETLWAAMTFAVRE